MREFNNLAAVKVLLTKFINDNDLNADFDEVMGTAQLNIDEQFRVRQSEEILDICRYLIEKDLIKTFFKD